MNKTLLQVYLNPRENFEVHLEGGAVTKSDDLTAEELEKIKKRSVTQPTPRARKSSINQASRFEIGSFVDST